MLIAKVPTGKSRPTAFEMIASITNRQIAPVPPVPRTPIQVSALILAA
jgi:hypothetical protein